MTRAKPASDPVAARARALADPTRLALLRTLQFATAPARVDELARAFDLHPNAVRQHLAALRDAGLVIEEQATRHGVGRPPLLYRVVDDRGSRSPADNPYEQLARLLVDVASGSDPAEVGAAEGRRLAAAIGAGDVVGVVRQGMRLLGFPNHVEDHAGAVDVVDIVLDHCPYATAARANPLVCEVHRGMAVGLAGANAAAIDLDVANPDTAGCRIRLNLSKGVKH